MIISITKWLLNPLKEKVISDKMKREKIARLKLFSHSCLMKDIPEELY